MITTEHTTHPVAGLGPAAHVFFLRQEKDVDARDKPGQGDFGNIGGVT